MTPRLTYLAALLTLSMATGMASADYNDAMRAVSKKDYAKALPLMKEAADQNNPDALYGMGVLYAQGLGVDKNPAEALKWFDKAAEAGNEKAYVIAANGYLTAEKPDYVRAQKWAEKSAAKGDVDGQFMVFYAYINNPANRYYDDNGKIDTARLEQLKKRSIEERSGDSKAFTMLSLAAEKGDANALQAALTVLLNSSAPGNNARILALMDKIGKLNERQQGYKTTLQESAKFGTSEVGPLSWKGVSATALDTAAARARADGMLKKGSCEAPRDVKLTSTAVSSPLAGAVYLPVNATLLKDFSLIKGNWQETWTYSVCGKPVPVTLMFEADGVGGNSYRTQSLGGTVVVKGKKKK